MAASIAYYALFSIFPLALLALTITGFVMGDDGATRVRILEAFPLDSEGGRKVLDETLVAMQEHRTARGIGAIVGFIALLFGASAVFGELNVALNKIARTPERQIPMLQAILGEVKDKLLSFGVVVLAGVLVLMSLGASTALGALGKITERELGQSPVVAWTWLSIETAVSLGFLTVVFALMYRTLPKQTLPLKHLVFGGFVTALLFTLLKRLLALYLTHVGGYSAYGAVGGILALLTWIWLCSMVVLFGAEMTFVHYEMRSPARQEKADPVADDGAHPHHGAHSHSVA